jgi:hypothetical protein
MGAKPSFNFFYYVKEQHNLKVTTHNKIVDMLDDAIIIIRGLEQTLAQKNTIIILKNTTIKRLQREIKGERIIRQNTLISLEVGSKRFIKLPDPLIFESRE